MLQLALGDELHMLQVKLTIQGEAYSGVMLQQTLVVDFQVLLRLETAQ